MSKPATVLKVLGRRTGFAQVSTAMLTDRSLSLEARGALSLIMSLPADWQFHFEWLQSVGGVGRDKARAIVAELRDAGYCYWQQERDGRGRTGATTYWFSDDKAAISALGNEYGKGATTSPFPCLPETAEPFPVNPHPTNKKRVLIKKDTLPFTSETRAARASPRKSVSAINELIEGRREPAIAPGLLADAEGFGLDAAALAVRAIAETPKQAARAFKGLCERAIADRLPGLSRTVIAAALSRDLDARRTVFELLTMAEASRT